MDLSERNWMDYKIMRMLCMFDLPVETDEEKIYSQII